MRAGSLTMMSDKALELLKQAGMSGYEAKAYTALLGAGEPLNGYEVAKLSGVPRSTVYETLGKLVARGAAFQVTEDDNVSYVPLPSDAYWAVSDVTPSKQSRAWSRYCPRSAKRSTPEWCNIFTPPTRRWSGPST